ncbi:UNVERIFIED_CONTAM: Retrovirus-related Pol polyprotein from transposon TNT 1-94 [Sesamum radiatum]|uniref:Retrovirus-related Pol polyprotein from transposon TNT 1-94 n=1 Tax=Sesamum radiatum TaxID=300843 RepID=A0AAW2W411_SESRA
MANEKLCDIHGLGDVCMIFENGFQLTLKNVRHVPDLAHNLMSCSALEEEGLEGKWGKGIMKISKGSLTMFKAERKRNLYVCTVKYISLAASVTKKNDSDLWHKRKTTQSAFSICPTPKPTSSSCILDYVHADVWGPANIETHGGNRYFLSIIDNFSRKSLVPKNVFIGYPEGVKGYRLWNSPKNTEEYNIETTFNKVENSLEDNQQREENREERIDEETEAINNETENENQYLLARDRERRETRIPSRFQDYHLALNIEHAEPTTFDEALKSPDSEQWLSAMKEEMKSLYDNKTWDLVPKPKDVSVVDLPIFLVLYVDDMLIASPSLTLITKLQNSLCKTFEMKDLGNAKKILGMTIERDRKNFTISLNQSAYINSVLKRFSMIDSKPSSVPLATHFQLCKEQCPKTDSEKKKMNKIPYSNAIGSVMYLMVSTRPDIAYAVSCLSRYMSNPGAPHWEALKWLLRYLKGSMNTGIKFSKCPKGVNLLGYVDSNYANDKDSRKSTTSYVFTLCGACISWKSQLQNIVALSTTEAEYIATTEAFKEAIWLEVY